MNRYLLAILAGLLSFPVLTGASAARAQEEGGPTEASEAEQAPDGEAQPAEEAAGEAAPAEEQMRAEAVAEALEEVPSPWSFAAKAGLVINTGNTEAKSFNGSMQGSYDRKPWRHRASASALYVSENGSATAQRFNARGESRCNFTEHNYVFGNTFWEDDKFSGFEYEVTYSAGIGRRFVELENFTFDAEAGGGARHLEPVGGEHEASAFGRVAVELHWKIADTTDFTQTADSEIGNDATGGITTRSKSELKVMINSHLALGVAFEIKHRTEVPAGTGNTDTTTSLNLVFTL